MCGESSGKTLAPEAVPLAGKPAARFLRITGLGNSENDWNSITEVKF